MKVAIAGAGNVGRAIARELISNGHQVLLIDKDPKALKMESVPTAVPTELFSAIVAAERAISAGASFTSVTEIAKTFSVKSPPWSVDRTRME